MALGILLSISNLQLYNKAQHFHLFFTILYYDLLKNINVADLTLIPLTFTSYLPSHVIVIIERITADKLASNISHLCI